MDDVGGCCKLGRNKRLILFDEKMTRDVIICETAAKWTFKEGDVPSCSFLEVYVWLSDLENLLSLQYPCCGMRHAIDTPICVPIFVADCYWKSAIVGTYHLYCLARITGYSQVFALASVGCLVFRSIRSLTWKWKKTGIKYRWLAIKKPFENNCRTRGECVCGEKMLIVPCSSWHDRLPSSHIIIRLIPYCGYRDDFVSNHNTIFFYILNDPAWLENGGKTISTPSTTTTLSFVVLLHNTKNARFAGMQDGSNFLISTKEI